MGDEEDLSHTNLLPSFYKWENWGQKKKCDLLKVVIHYVYVKFRTHLWPELLFLGPGSAQRRVAQAAQHEIRRPRIRIQALPLDSCHEKVVL